MSKIQKRRSRITIDIREFILKKKETSKSISCRFLVNDVFQKFHVKISKSSINSILKSSNLSGPVGRPVSASFRKVGFSKGAGYIFLLGSDFLLGFSKIIAEIVSKNFQDIHRKLQTLELVCQALILSKAIYNVPLRKIVDYRKDELWLLMGKRVNKGLLKQFIDIFNITQNVKEQLVTEFSRRFLDVHYLKILLADGSSYCCDGLLKSVWTDSMIPFDFCVNYDIAMNYVETYFKESEIFILLSLLPGTGFGNEFFDFVFSFSNSVPEKQILKLQFIGFKGDVIYSYELNNRAMRKFIIGVSAKQYRPVEDFAKNAAWRACVFEHLEEKIYCAETLLKLPQDIDSKEVILRLIVFKTHGQEEVEQAILTNIDAAQLDMDQIARAYLERFPDLNGSIKLFTETIKNPLYLEQVVSMRKMIEKGMEIRNCQDIDAVFWVFVEILNLFAKRSFLAKNCYEWSILKIRELFFKQDGLIRRDLSSEIIFKLFGSNMLYDKSMLNKAIVKFNDSPVFDLDGKKLLIDFRS